MTDATPRRPPRRIIAAIAGVAVLVVAAGVITSAVRHHGHHGHDGVKNASSAGSAAGGAPTVRPQSGLSLAAAGTVADAYYLAVKNSNAHTAFGLLCATQQQQGYTAYAAQITLDTQTGTAVTAFRLTGKGEVKGAEAAVPAQVGLADGETTPIAVLLSAQSGSWRVCSSDLGGVLPGPGTATTPSPSTSPGIGI